MKTLLLWLVFLGLCAHELRPAYLDLREVGHDVFAVLWKVPATGPADLALQPDFGAGAEVIGTIAMSLPQGNLVRRWTQRIPDLATAGIGFAERDGVAYDILIHIRSRDGSDQVHRLPPGEARLVLPERPTALASLGVYTIIGIEHILIGLDHVLFVLGLLLLVRGWRPLVATVTAFTIAHSITLAATALDLVHPPMRPVEACIALSLVLLAVEVIRSARDGGTWSARHPWAIAFPFGLLHGFGFAGALAEVGLPHETLGFALLGFNLGVEVGQLAIVAVGLLVLTVCRRLRVPDRFWAGVPAYALGGVAACWVIGRMLD